MFTASHLDYCRYKKHKLIDSNQNIRILDFLEIIHTQDKKILQCYEFRRCWELKSK